MCIGKPIFIIWLFRFLENGLTTLELPSLSQLKDGKKEPNIEAYWNTFKVGTRNGIKMLKLGPMKNNLNLKFGNNMGTMIWSSIIDERHKRLKNSLRFKRNSKYFNSTWGLDSRAFENNKAKFKNKTNTPSCNSNTLCLNNENFEETLHYINFKAFTIIMFSCYLHN